MTLRRQIVTLVGMLALALALTPACTRTQRECPDAETGEPPIDPTLLAFLSRARAAHHIADLKEDSDSTGAIAALAAVVDGPVPGRADRAPAEAREVMADTQARIADIQSRLFRFDDALRRIESALGWVPETSYFRGHLFETRGLVEQRQADEFAKSNRPNEALAAKVRALTAFETAMQIQANVIRKTPLDSSGNPTPALVQTSVPAPSAPTSTQGANR